MSIAIEEFRPIEAPVPSRRDYLSWREGRLNIASVVAAHMALGSAFYVGWFWFPLPLYIPLMLVASLVHQRTMSEWVHEAAHYNFVPNRAWNDALTNVLCSSFLGSTVATYRSGHMRHHGKPSFFDDDDADTGFSRVASRRSLYRQIIADLTGINALRGYLRLYVRPRLTSSKGDPSKRWALARTALCLAAGHSSAIAMLFALGRLDAYVLYYTSILTLYSLFNRIRAYGQHVEIGPDGRGLLLGSRASRTIDAGPLDRLLFTSRVMMYHHEHHAYPHLPYRACRVLCARNDPARLADPNRYSVSRWLPLRALLRGLPAVTA